MMKEITPPAKQALQQFLKTLLGHDLPLSVKDPSEAAPDDLPLQSFAVTAYNADHHTIVLLEETWVPLLSEAMLGEVMQFDDDGARDLLGELTGQGYGAIRNALSASEVQLPDLTFEVAFETPSLELPDPLTLLPFMAEDGETALRGIVAFPADILAGSASDSKSSTDIEDETDASETTPAPEADDTSSSQTEDSVDVAPASFSELGEENVGGDGTPENFDLLAGVELEVTVELGRRHLPLADVLRLTTGSVIELEKLVGEPLEIYANDRFIAEGEAVVIDEQFGVRITSIASRRQRNKAFF